jgi:hypothetical protein
LADVEIGRGTEQLRIEKGNREIALAEPGGVVDTVRPCITERVVDATESSEVRGLLREAQLQGVVVGIRSVFKLLLLAKAAVGNIRIKARRRYAIGIRICERGKIARPLVQESLGIGAVERRGIERVDVDEGRQTMGRTADVGGASHQLIGNLVLDTQVVLICVRRAEVWVHNRCARAVAREGSEGIRKNDTMI